MTYILKSTTGRYFGYSPQLVDQRSEAVHYVSAHAAERARAKLSALLAETVIVEPAKPPEVHPVFRGILTAHGIGEKP